MDRLYTKLIAAHFSNMDEMLFLNGPRQVGKTTGAQAVGDSLGSALYLNWDDLDHRQLLLAGPKAIAQAANLEQASTEKRLLIFDEIHKYKDWKQLLKGFFDTYRQATRIVVTGSARMDVYKRGGDSLMGRYFPYRMHPLSVAECLGINFDLKASTLVSAPQPVDQSLFDRLYRHGGFPKPFLTNRDAYSLRWQNLRFQQLMQEDVRDTSRVHEIAQMEVLAKLLQAQAGQILNYTKLAKKIRISVPTIERWISVLESLYYCYTLRPWSKNLSRALIKTPKCYLWDWSVIKDPGARAENFVASHLQKAVHLWTDLGLGVFELYFIRSLDKHEVDFVVVRDNQPWFLVEVKCASNQALSKDLYRYHALMGTAHAFQVAFDLPDIDKSCFDYTEPVLVPATTFLSQLV